MNSGDISHANANAISPYWGPGSDRPAPPLGWGKFLGQFLSVALIYQLAAVPALLNWGNFGSGPVIIMSGNRMLISGAVSMVAALLTAALWLKRDGALQAAFALQPPADWRRALVMAAGAAMAVLLWFQLGAWALEQLGLPPLDAGPLLKFVTESPVSLILWIVGIAWFAAGFGEELLWRGFLLDRLLRLRGIAGRAWVAILVQAVIFGLPHAYQGLSGIILTGTIGIFFGWMRMRLTNSLWPLIIAHALVDTIAMSLAYYQAHYLA